jgi:hypothetical protein
MKKALIAPNEPVNFFDGKTGYRVAQTEPAENIFAVAEPLYWLDCNDEVVADQFYYDPTDATIKAVPVPPPPAPAPVGGAPNVIA